MPLHLCSDCLKNHMKSDFDAIHNVYCYHTYMKLKDQWKKKSSKKLVDERKDINETQEDIIKKDIMKKDL